MANKLTIWILGKDKPDDKKTVAHPSRRIRKLGRRRIFSGPFLRVFDLGQFSGGTDNPLHYASELTGGGFFSFTQDGQTGGDNATWNTDIFINDYNDWAETFKDITFDLEDYPMTIDGFDETVSGKGLRRSGGSTTMPTVANTQNKYFPTWAGHKVTNTTTYSDPSVVFTFDKNTDLFLVPQMFTRNGRSRTTSGGFHTDDFFIYFKTPLSRQSTVNNSTWDSIWSKRTNQALLTVGEIAQFRSHLLSNQSPLEYRFTYLAIDPGPPPHDYDTNPATSFPTILDEPSWTTEPYIDLEPAAQFAGKIIAAFRKHLGNDDYEWYFVWASSTWPLGITGWDLMGIVV